MKAIEIKGLRKIYHDRRRRQVVALENLSLDVEPGEIYGFLGPNGAGKSTTIKTMVGLIKPTEGYVRVSGRSVTDVECRRTMGYLPENPAFYDFLSAREYMMMIGRVFRMEENHLTTEVDRILDLLDLTSAQRRPIRTYSKGMVQRLGIAQTLVHDPDLYILDEPMSGLDPVGRVLVKDILRDLKARGKTVFFSTHVTADVEAVCDKVAIIAGGQLQSVNHVRELLEKGVEGYSVHFSDCILAPGCGFAVDAISDNLYQAYVVRGEINAFMSLIAERGGEVQMIETRRHDLEKFFMDVISSEK